jgi:protein O-mannosyl-transferase
VLGRQDRQSPTHEPHRLAAAMVALFLAAGALYLPTLHHAFVFDDEAHITQNPVVLRGLGWDGLGWAFTTLSGTSWHPLTWLSYMAGIEIFGPLPGPQHAAGLLLHAASTALLMLALVRLTGAYWRSALVAALFALHPLHVESVAYAAERKDVLSALFWCCALAAYARYTRRPGAAAYCVVAGFFSLSLMSKPMAVTLPFVLLLLDAWPLGRLFPAGRPATLRPRLAEKMPLLALSAAVTVLTILGGVRSEVLVGFETLPFAARLKSASTSCVLYLLNAVWPARLAAYYPLPPEGTPSQAWVPALLFLGAVTALAVRERRRRPWLAAGWTWFLITLLPVSGIVPIGFYARADRYTYLPLVGIFVIAAWGGHELFRRLRLGAAAAAAVSTLVLALLAVAAHQQIGYWRDPVTLFGHALEVTERNWVAHYGMAQALGKAGKTAAAEEHYRQAISLNPGYKEARNNLGVILAARGDLEGALAQFRAALAVRPRAAELYVNIALTLEQLGRPAEAAASYRAALEIDPGDAAVRAALGRLAREGRARSTTVP